MSQDTTHTNEGADGPGTQPRTPEKSGDPGEEVGERSACSPGEGRGRLREAAAPALDPGRYISHPRRKGRGLGLARAWNLGSLPGPPRIPPAAAGPGWEGPRRADPPGTGWISGVYKHGVAGQGLCLSQSTNPPTRRLDSMSDERDGRRALSGDSVDPCCCSASKKPSSQSVSAVVPETELLTATERLPLGCAWALLAPCHHRR